MEELLRPTKTIVPPQQPLATEELCSRLSSISSERNYQVRHTRERLDEFSIIILSQIYSIPGPHELKDASKYWGRQDSPSAKIKSLLRSIRAGLLTN